MSSALAHSDQNVGSGFDRFRLHPSLLAALKAAGFETPRPIQTEAIPACLEGRDVLGLAQTGTGKTAAFALPILQRLIQQPAKATCVLILAPTRELARQIDEEIRSLARATKIGTATVFGGMPQGPQARALRRRPAIVVGCPGRVLDLIQQGVFDVRQIDTLVLDEADHMFDLGFFKDIERILARLPKRRQNLLFSATMPDAVRRLASGILDDPHVIELASKAPSAQIEHFLYSVREDAKREVLDHLLASDDCQSAIVFMRTKHRAKHMAERLSREGHRAIALQGNMSQPQRDRAMRGFREGRYDVLVATDIVARGIDVAGIDYVINFDVPNTPEAYTHRIGRTGRSEATGKACTFVTSADRAWLRATERLLGGPIEVRETPIEGAEERPVKPAPRSDARRSSRPRRGPGNGHRRSGSKSRSRRR